MTYTHEDYLKDKATMDAHYKGDKEQEKADIEHLFSAAIMWSDVETYAAVYPEYSHYAEKEIERLLGYLPHQNIIILHEPFIRALIAQYNQGQISADEYHLQLTPYVKHVRNDDMKKFLWHKTEPYNPEEFAHYQNTLPEFAEAAQARIWGFFNYLPDLEYRMSAELVLRRLLKQMPDYFTSGLSDWDYKVFTIIYYRMELMKYGQESADNSLLLYDYHQNLIAVDS